MNDESLIFGFHARENSATHAIACVAAPIDAVGLAAFVLESNGDALKFTFDQTRFWLGRIEFAGVPIV